MKYYANESTTDDLYDLLFKAREKRRKVNQAVEAVKGQIEDAYLDECVESIMGLFIRNDVDTINIKAVVQKTVNKIVDLKEE
ncbi:hypothetical protein CHCC5027_3575 [Bacillus paralicheniformis]|uniref:hypothetical protein n=1 Tax=Bacillus paralicheniformis TaxID=1648923 RepID=UPI0011A88272|nr:hypothetical protein [Bacillus paralicheniformis]TWJ39662.1 hypothetical protein CHCC5027_3575 [Bacillus paralicheniformis]